MYFENERGYTNGSKKQKHVSQTTGYRGYQC